MLTFRNHLSCFVCNCKRSSHSEIKAKLCAQSFIKVKVAIGKVFERVASEIMLVMGGGGNLEKNKYLQLFKLTEMNERSNS